jgi:hypothetical protein
MFRERVSPRQGDLSADRDVPCPCRAVLSRDQEVLSVHLERRQERATVPLQTLECVIECYNRAAPACNRVISQRWSVGGWHSTHSKFST